MIELDGHTLTVQTLAKIARGAPARLADAARERMWASHQWLVAHGDLEIVHRKWAWIGGGRPDPDGNVARIFIEGHCAAVGDPLPTEAVRALMAARANVLALGYSGCRPEAAEVLLAMLQREVIPVVPSLGSTGAAGSAPLAHIVRVACGWGGMAWRDGELLPASQAMEGLPILRPTEKEALSLINGSTLTTALGALACDRARRTLRAAEAACALSFEVVRADRGCLSHAALQARGHLGALDVAARLRELLQGSELVTPGRQADSFSIRCAPAVLGAARDGLAYTTQVVERELNAAVDNPLVIPGEGLVEAGNFHGAPVALALDHLKAALTQVASIAERRIFRLTYAKLSGLPSFLMPSSGVDSGLMLAQYTAASLVSECKQLSHPASVDSIPTVQHHEDHVSMGPIAARSALHIVELLADVVAIELLCGAQGLDFRMAGEGVDAEGRPTQGIGLRPGRGTLQIHQKVRERVSRWTEDQVMHPDLVALGQLVREGALDPEVPGAW